MTDERQPVPDWADMIAERDAEIERLNAEVARLKTGYQGACYACEPVGELNIRFQAEVERKDAALEIMSMMGGYTKLHPDETASSIEQQTYSWGVSDGYKEMAEMARAALTSQEKTDD